MPQFGRRIRLQARPGCGRMLAAGFTAQTLVPGFEACKTAMQREPRVLYSRGPSRYSFTAARVFIRFLQDQGELPLPLAPPSATDLWPRLGEFRSWMRQHRGLTETTLDVYQGTLEEESSSVRRHRAGGIAAAGVPWTSIFGCRGPSAKRAGEPITTVRCA
jgi:hypothetical protein